MNQLGLITKSLTGEIHSIIVLNKNRLRAVPVAFDSVEWVAWIDDSNADFDDVKNCLDFDLQNELPQLLTTKVLCDVQDRAGFAASREALLISDSDSFLRIKQYSKNLGFRYLSRAALVKEDVPSFLFYRPLSEFADPLAAANFKAHRFVAQKKYAAFAMQLKAVRAVYDPNIGPGGGWRCPDGTVNGGQITDRFGRGCGGLTRRLGRLLGSISGGATERDSNRRRTTIPRPSQPSSSKPRSSRRSRQGSRSQRLTSQSGRVFDREQSPSQGVADAFRRTPEYQRQRDELNAAQATSRRSTVATRTSRNSGMVASERLTREQSRLDNAEPPKENTREEPEVSETSADPSKRQRRQITEPVTETSDAMANRPSKRDYFAEDTRSLDDPVKKDIIEGSKLEQLEDLMRESEKEFSFGRDPSGSFQAAEQFSRAYNAIAREVRQAVRQLQAYDNGEIGLSEEEVNNLESFLIKSKAVLDAELPGFNFAIDVDTAFQMPFGRTVNLGLAHPMFDDDDRMAFIEARADFLAELYEASGDRDLSFAERLKRVDQIFSRSSADEKQSLTDQDSKDVVRQRLVQAGQRPRSDKEIKDFFKNEFGVERALASKLADGLEKLETSVRQNKEIDERVRNAGDLVEIEQRVEAFEQMIRDRHFAVGEFIINLLGGRESPFAGQAGDEILQAFKNLDMLELFDGVDEIDLRSENGWRRALQQMEMNESKLYFGMIDALDVLKNNYLQRNRDVDSGDRYKALIKLAEGSYNEAAKDIIAMLYPNNQNTFKQQLVSSFANSLEKMFPKNINNEALVQRIEQTAAMAGIVDTAKKNVILNESRQAMERRRNIISLIGEKAQERINQVVQRAKNRRRSAFGSWLEKNHGRWDAKPWSDYRNRLGNHVVTPDGIDNILAEYGTNPQVTAEVDDWVDRVYNIDYQLPDGYVMSSTVNRIMLDSGGLEIEGSVTLTAPDGRRRDIGEFSRVLGANAHYQRSPATVHNAVLSLLDFDLETMTFLPNGWEDDLRKQGIDPLTKKTTKGAGFSTVFNQHAWGWLKDAGFEDVSISAGLEDGGYVWARMGFKPEKRDEIIEFWSKIDEEIFRYEQAVDSDVTLIKTDLQAAMLRQLSQDAKNHGYDPSVSPAHMEVIMALETDFEDYGARRKEIRDWIYANKVQLGRASISILDDDFESLDPNTENQGSPTPPRSRRRVTDAVIEQSDPMVDRPMSPSGVNRTIYNTPPRDLPEQLGLISSKVLDSGDVARPTEIVNPSIASADDAVSFVRNGGSLNEVPNEFWPDVLEQNSSSDPNDADALFYSRPVRQGIGGWVSVYIAKNPDGTLSTSGWAVKNSAGRMAFTRRWSETDKVGRNHSAVFDVLGFNLAATAGLIPHGAGYGGTQKRSVADSRNSNVEVYVNSTVLPLHLSLLPDGMDLKDVTFPEDADFDAEIFKNAKLRAIPQRVGLLIHSWALGVSDRHKGNMASFVDKDGNGYVFPFDYGMLLDRSSGLAPESIKEYLENWVVSFADANLPEEAKEFLASASFEDRQQLRDEINRIVDRMLDGYASAISEGFAPFKNTAMAGFQSTFDRMRQDDPDSEVDLEDFATSEKRRIIQRLQGIYDSLWFVVDMRQDIKDELTELILGE
jgi:hypothetical protein